MLVTVQVPGDDRVRPSSGLKYARVVGGPLKGRKKYRQNRSHWICTV